MRRSDLAIDRVKDALPPAGEVCAVGKVDIL